MAELPESNEWIEGIYQLETSDPVLGGPEGIDNLQAKQLASRTKWLKGLIEKIVDGTTAIGKAARLETTRAFEFVGAAAGSGNFDGSADTEITLTLADSGVTAGTFSRVAVNAKGIVTGGSNIPVVAVATSKTLISDELGLVLIDSSAAALTIQLPSAAPALGVRDVVVRRTDNTGNRLVIKAAGTDKIKFHTHLRAEGYPFFVLMGAGDYWHLRSDGAGNWFPVARFDSTPLGRPVVETTTAIAPGGWGLYHGLIYNRAEWPWAWDHAQQSGMLTTEALRAGKEGHWTSGDGVDTFRTPEGRGVFMRLLDEARGIDASRQAGSQQLDALQNITGSMGALNGVQIGGTATGAFNVQVNGAVSLPGGSGTTGCIQMTFDASRVARTSTETRPINLAYPGRLKLI